MRIEQQLGCLPLVGGAWVRPLSNTRFRDRATNVFWGAASFRCSGMVTRRMQSRVAKLRLNGFGAQGVISAIACPTYMSCPWLPAVNRHIKGSSCKIKSCAALLNQAAFFFW